MRGQNHLTITSQSLENRQIPKTCGVILDPEGGAENRISVKLCVLYMIGVQCVVSSVHDR